MKKIHLLVIKSFIGPLLLTFAIAMFALLMQFIWKYVDDLVGKGLDMLTILKFLYYAALTLVPMALPLSVLLASLMTFGNLGERYELVAMKAAGISLENVFRPLLIFAIAISGIAFYFSNSMVPEAFLKYRTLLHDIQTKKPAVNINAGEYYNGIDGYTIRIGKKDRHGESIENVQIYDHSDNDGNTRLTIAERGRMSMTTDGRYLVFDLQNGYNYAEDLSTSENRRTRPFTRGHFETQTLRFDLSDFEMPNTDQEMFANHRKGLNVKQLQYRIDTIDEQLNNRTADITSALMTRYLYLSRYYQDDDQLPILEKSAEKSAGSMELARRSAQHIMNDLEYYQGDIKQQKENLAMFKVEWHQKFSLSIACVILFLIGASLGSIIRRGGLGVPVVVSIVLFITYHVISMFGEMYVKTGVISAWQGIWLSTAIFLPVGLFLTYKAITDSAVLDADAWRNFFKRLFKK